MACESHCKTDKKLLKILCIHGYRQNANTFREKTGAFRKIVKKYADMEFPTAPHRVPPGNQGSAAWTQVDATPDSEIPGERGWWFSKEDDYFKSVDYSDIDKGFEESLQMVIELLENADEKYDGILGFSQGATLVSILCLLQEQQEKTWFKFAMMFAGFKSRCSPHDILYKGMSRIPSMHVYGESDQIVCESMSEELLNFFENPTVLRHPGGHFIPASAPQKKEYITFLEAMSKLCGIERK